MAAGRREWARLPRGDRRRSARWRWGIVPRQVLATAAFVACPVPSARAYEVHETVYIPPDVQYPGTFRHSIEISPDGGVYVSGRNDFGQLGIGTNTHVAEPQRVKSSARFVPGLAVKVNRLGPRVPSDLDTLEGQTGDVLEYDYPSERWIVRMHDGSGTTRMVYGRPEELEGKYPLDDDVPPASTSPPGSRRRSGCRVTTEEKQQVWLVHDDGSRSLIATPSTQECVTTALPLPDLTLRMYLPRYGFGEETGYRLSETDSELACVRTPPCTACNTYDDDEICPNDETLCNPPIGKWQHEKCRLKFTPGLVITARQLKLTPQVELNKRVGHLVQVDLRYGVEWEVKLTPISCTSGLCDGGNVISLSLPLHLIDLDGEAYDAAAGAFHTLFLWRDWCVWAAGKNTEGQLGDGTTINRNFPTFIINNVMDVAAGYFHSVYLLKNGTALTAGRNKEGQLGDGTVGQRTKPVAVLSGVSAVAAGAYHTIFLMNDKSVWATGSNTYGQLGDGGTVSRTSPVRVFENVESVRVGDFHTLFVQYDPVREETSLWAAGMFDAGIGRSRAGWSPLQYYNQSEVKQMAVSV